MKPATSSLRFSSATRRSALDAVAKELRHKKTSVTGGELRVIYDEATAR
jgi:hypothetical protein